MTTNDKGWSPHADHYDADERYVGPPMHPDGHWRLAADDETMIWVPAGADGRAIERAVRGTALQRWQDGQAANEAFGPGGAW